MSAFAIDTRPVRHAATNELGLGDYAAILRRRWRWFVLPLLAVPAAFVTVADRRPDRFEARAEVLLDETAAQEAVQSTNQNTSYRSRALENELSLARSDAAQATVAGRFGVAPDDVPPILVTVADGSDVLVFTARAGDADRAADAANAWAETYVELKQTQAEESITAAVDRLRERLAGLQAERTEVRATLVDLEDDLAVAVESRRPRAQQLVDRETSRISGDVALIDAQITAVIDSINELQLSGELALSGSARVMNEANAPLEPVGIPPVRSVVFGLFVGAVVGAASALLREHLDRAIRAEADIEGLGAVSLGALPRTKRLKPGRELDVLTDIGGPEAEAAQKLQSAVQFLADSQGVRSIVITSAQQGDGKTTTAAGLAMAMARIGRRTLLIDGDLRRPRIHKLFDEPQSPGITNTALGLAEAADAAHPQLGISESLVVIPSGGLPPHPAGFLSSAAFGDTISQLRDLADITIVDAAPVLPVADTLALAPRVDGAIVVVHAGRTHRADLAETLDALAQAGATVLGCVLVGVRGERGRYEYRYDTDDDRLDRLSALEVTGVADGDQEPEVVRPLRTVAS